MYLWAEQRMMPFSLPLVRLAESVLWVELLEVGVSLIALYWSFLGGFVWCFYYLYDFMGG